ncbi:thiaminase II [Halomonas huangheensis]|uniref:Aminopyrimidine aminohydrolase n=1 Tax=Halomonas huangheensis TaxID=1178482 RepID=W1N975_9GAMM|nr:thiaminase II [Halomonas huangheensis]ALM53178.1 thiaminase II [Halomonas huangheensis]ERL51465.1 hypothetical protein BJB45_13680 [Halomonas huangheensis]
MGYRFNDLVDACHDEWTAYIEHDFVTQLGRGSLSQDSFRHYLKQDYLFLIQFSRAYALAAYKSHSLDELRSAFEGLKIILDTEMQLHLDYCAEWGITQHQLENLPEARATLAYTRYVLDAGARGDLLDLRVALAPCMIGYADIALWLNEQDFTQRGNANPFDAWIAMYLSEEFQQAAHHERVWLDEQLRQLPDAHFQRLALLFRDATRLERDFWQMGLDLSD